MRLKFSTRGRNMVLGALVADAAAMGLHWLYDQERIAQVAGDAPEFLDPAEAHYADTSGYFAHGHLKAGDQSHYGAQLKAMLASLEATGGVFNKRAYADAFHDYFGYGGAYVGYIDRPTRETLDNYRRAEQDALTRAKALAVEGQEAVTTAMITKAMSLIGRLSGDDLREAFIQAVRATHDDDAVVAHGLEVLAVMATARDTTGAYDFQLPALSKLPALIAAQEQSGRLEDTQAIEDAVAVTNDHPSALAYGRVAAAMLTAALESDDLEVVISEGRKAATPEIAALLDEAVARRNDSAQDATAHFGMACYLNSGVPSAVHNVLSAGSYKDAVRRNILAGGDSCGRSILLGAILGAVHGVDGAHGIPSDWIAKLSSNPLR